MQTTHESNSYPAYNGVDGDVHNIVHSDYRGSRGTNAWWQAGLMEAAQMDTFPLVKHAVAV